VAKDLSWQTYQQQIQSLSTLDFNYDEKVYHATKNKQGWHVDKYHATLAKEPAGEPLPDGAFQVAQTAIRLYQFPDPRLISAVFDPEAALPGRNMLMFAHFAGFTFNFGVRVTAVIDEVRTNETGERVKVWGYSYRTLKGHFEIGEIRFEVSKNLQSGEVAFDINAYSKPDRIPNIFYRTGFRIFSRPLQKYFASSSIKRLQAMAGKAMEKQTAQQAAKETAAQNLKATQKTELRPQ
jgi:hypothetical protein